MPSFWWHSHSVFPLDDVVQVLFTICTFKLKLINSAFVYHHHIQTSTRLHTARLAYQSKRFQAKLTPNQLHTQVRKYVYSRPRKGYFSRNHRERGQGMQIASSMARVRKLTNCRTSSHSVERSQTSPSHQHLVTPTPRSRPPLPLRRRQLQRLLCSSTILNLASPRSTSQVRQTSIKSQSRPAPRPQPLLLLVTITSHKRISHDRESSPNISLTDTPSLITLFRRPSTLTKRRVIATNSHPPCRTSTRNME